MSDPFNWDWTPIHLGRWFGTQVRVHAFFLFFALFALLFAAFQRDAPVLQTLGWLTMLALALASHELGHALAAARLGAEPEDVRIWPLGNFVAPAPVPPSRAPEVFRVALTGPLTSLALALAAAIGLRFAGYQMIFNPFGNGDPKVGSGVPFLLKDHAAFAAFPTGAWWVGWFGYINWVIFLANMFIPALPMDCGRAVRAWLAGQSLGQPKDSMLAPYIGKVVALILVAAGLLRLIFFRPGDNAMALIGLAILIYLMAQAEIRLLEDGGFFDEGVFGYDFSEGYTSLEGSTQKVRPYRESALKRWRRRRSELRRQRRLAREAAEERRMDEILDKIHREGRSALTDEENRFLIRVSAKYRHKPKARD